MILRRRILGPTGLALAANLVRAVSMSMPGSARRGEHVWMALRKEVRFYADIVPDIDLNPDWPTTSRSVPSSKGFLVLEDIVVRCVVRSEPRGDLARSGRCRAQAARVIVAKPAAGDVGGLAAAAHLSALSLSAVPLGRGDGL
ncbi:hypothetical protein ABH939_005965 [Rhodococcus sp. 27YEA6]